MAVKAAIIWEAVMGMVPIHQKITEMEVRLMVGHHPFPRHLLQHQVAWSVQVLGSLVAQDLPQNQ